MRSLRYALLLAIGYALLAALYIVVSSRIAASMSASVDELARIETVKGVLYVVVTAIAIFAGGWVLMRRLELADDEIRRRDAAILASERQAFAGLLAATTAHDANNVLMTVIADLQALRDTFGDRPEVARLEAATERLIALNRRLLDTVRQGREPESADLPLLPEVHSAIDAIRTTLRVRGCDVRIDGDPSVRLRAHPLLIHRVVGNLVLNAAEATQSHGRIDVRVLRHGDRAAIEVHDDGPGVPESLRAGLFQRLATTKSGGSGLGLFSVLACARALGGVAEVGASPLGGACFRVVVPALPAATNGRTAPALGDPAVAAR
jgi:signal transduction histidine kinase